ncbi:MAG TPA: hypothetical protein VHW23_30015 [Kofleriaceae bacterium]|nr:hypothetical protein [Kofleriaceae bacterium]
MSWLQVAAAMQSTHTWSAVVSEKLVDRLFEKLDRLEVPEPIEQRDWHVVSLIPVSHMQMCMHADVIEVCDTPVWLELQAAPASAAHAQARTAAAIHVVRTCAA